MRTDLTDLTVVLDRSGSMASSKTDAEGGLNTFVEKQKSLPGECHFSLVQFDTVYEFVHRGVPINDVGHLTLEPRGSTALLDALGRAIIETGERLKGVDESQRPGLVAFVVITDGQENASREMTREKLREMIEHQQNVYKWQFTFLGANQDAFAEAGALGIDPDAVADMDCGNIEMAFDAASGTVGRMRSATFGGQAVSNKYSDQERKAMKRGPT